MKTEVMRRAFDPFFTTRRQREQFGLGLFKARGDMARMKGRIYAESDGKSYTEVIVELPTGREIRTLQEFRSSRMQFSDLVDCGCPVDKSSAANARTSYGSFRTPELLQLLTPIRLRVLV